MLYALSSPEVQKQAKSKHAESIQIVLLLVGSMEFLAWLGCKRDSLNFAARRSIKRSLSPTPSVQQGPDLMQSKVGRMDQSQLHTRPSTGLDELRSLVSLSHCQDAARGHSFFAAVHTDRNLRWAFALQGPTDKIDTTISTEDLHAECREY